jgi:hypothetical protein
MNRSNRFFKKYIKYLNFNEKKYIFKILNHVSKALETIRENISKVCS